MIIILPDPEKHFFPYDPDKNLNEKWDPDPKKNRFKSATLMVGQLSLFLTKRKKAFFYHGSCSLPGPAVYRTLRVAPAEAHPLLQTLASSCPHHPRPTRSTRQ